LNHRRFLRPSLARGHLNTADAALRSWTRGPIAQKTYSHLALRASPRPVKDTRISTSTTDRDVFAAVQDGPATATGSLATLVYARCWPRRWYDSFARVQNGDSADGVELHRTTNRTLGPILSCLRRFATDLKPKHNMDYLCRHKRALRKSRGVPEEWPHCRHVRRWSQRRACQGRSKSFPLRRRKRGLLRRVKVPPRAEDEPAAAGLFF